MEVNKKSAPLDQRTRAEAKCREVQSMLCSWKVWPVLPSRVKRPANCNVEEIEND